MSFNTLPPTIELKLRSSICVPSRSTDGAAGYDVYANLPQEYQLLPGQSLRIPLGFALSLRSADLCAVLLPRSGLGQRGLVLTNTIGLIDSDYQGEVIASVRLREHTEPLLIRPFDRIAQLVFLPVIHPHFMFTEVFSIDTPRGHGGFGSTGVSP